MVPLAGVEPTRLTATASKAVMSTSSIIEANWSVWKDLNLRHLHSKRRTLTRLSYTQLM